MGLRGSTAVGSAVGPLGIGYLVVVRPGDATRAASMLRAAGERVFGVGEIRAGARKVEYD